MDPATLLVVRCSPKALALGAVLVGQNGVGEIKRLGSEEAVESGCGLWLLQSISATVLSEFDDVQFDMWHSL